MRRLNRIVGTVFALLSMTIASIDAVELVQMSQLLRQGFELTSVVMQPPLEKDGYATERLYLQKGAQVVVCVFNLKPSSKDEDRTPAFCAVGLYEGR